MQEQNYSIRDWAKDDRPREKLLSKGAENLSNSELLGILIQNGIPRKSAVDLGRDILRLGKDNLNELGRLSVKDLMRVRGVGEAKAVMIAAALELGRRRQAGSSLEKRIVKASADIAAYLQPVLGDYKREVFGVVLLNQANRIKHFEILSEGGITATVADPRVVLRKALEEEAVSLVLFHNHPSGSLEPSRADEELTIKIKAAAAYFDIRLIDHLIIGENGYYSFAEDGRL